MKPFKFYAYLLPFFIYIFIAHIIFFAFPFSSPTKQKSKSKKITPTLMVIEECLHKEKKTVQRSIIKTKRTPSVAHKPKIKHRNIPLPSPIKKLHSEISKKTLPLKKRQRLLDYENQIVFLMQKQLKLPKYGEVKIAITLHCSGKVIDIKVLTSHNHENKAYLLQSIPKLFFPPFEEYEKDNQQTFVINFFND